VGYHEPCFGNGSWGTRRNGVSVVREKVMSEGGKMIPILVVGEQGGEDGGAREGQRPPGEKEGWLIGPKARGSGGGGNKGKNG